MDDKGLYIVTGATGGIGRALTEGLCRKGLRVVMACRNMEKAEAVRQGIMRSGRAGNGEITVRTLDMASLGSIGRFAEELRSEGGRDRSAGQQRRRDERPFRPDRRRNRAVHGRQLRGALRIDPAAAADDRGRGTDRQYAVGHLPHRPDRSPTFRARAATVRTFQELRLVEAGAAAVHARAGPANGGDASASTRPTRAWSTRA